jgi:galactose-1-phosphate uridylyltransferase
MGLRPTAQLPRYAFQFLVYDRTLDVTIVSANEEGGSVMVKKQQMTIFISSPNDLIKERETVRRVTRTVDESIGDELKITLRTKDWESLPPSAQKAQEYINKKIGDYDIYVGIMGNRFGTKTDKAESGTQEEFERAYAAWQSNGKPEIMFYFYTKSKTPANAAEAEQLLNVFRFQEELSSKILWKNYADSNDFERKFREDLESKIKEIILNPKFLNTSDKLIGIDRETLSYTEIEDTGQSWKTHGINSSFSPRSGSDGPRFDRVRIPTTPGWEKVDVVDSDANNFNSEKFQDNFVYVIKDPIRPFGIQVGETRSRRHQGNPNAIPDLTNLDLKSIKNMYPFLQTTGFTWIRMVLAELSTDPKILQFIHDNDPEPHVKSIASRNPSASSKLKKEECIFCNDAFLKNRKLQSGSNKTSIIYNDFPYGPYFHYIAFPSRPIHAWEELNLSDIYDLNLTLWKFLNHKKTHAVWIPDPAGVFIGLNSTIRHLVMGTKTLTSAGASIPHIHKQAWGMVSGANGLGSYLDSICKHYEANCDYLNSYLEFVREQDMVLYEDCNVALYVPLGQISIHELQIMVKTPGNCDYLSLSKDEIISISKAEAMAIEFLKALEITSFNEIMISLPFGETSKWFHLIMCFLTREVDIAVSELNQMFVVDKHPESTAKILRQIKATVMRTVEDSAAAMPDFRVSERITKLD